jgi:putative phage-type endonuclease
MKKHPETLAYTEQLTNEEWLEIRRKGIGGSDAGTVLGKNPYKSPLTLWAEKRGELTNEFTGNEATAWGHLLEEPIAKRFAEVTGLAVIRYPVVLQHPHCSWMLANVDYFVSDDAETWTLGEINDWVNCDGHLLDNVTHILEIKTAGIASRGNAKAWENDGVPESYYWQGAHYANVTGVKDVYFAALIGGEGLVIRERHYNDSELMDLQMAEADFWQDVQSGTTPEVTGSDDEAETIKALYPVDANDSFVEADDFLLDTLDAYVELKNTLDAQEKELKRLRADIELAIGENSGISLDGNVLVTYKATKTSETFDAKAFKTAHPDLAATFTKVKPGYRVLRVKGGE